MYNVRSIRPPRPGAQRQKTSSSQTTILVVDDDETIRNFIHETLSLFGYRVVATGESQEAEKILQRLGPVVISLVIVDVHLTANPQVPEGYVFYEYWTTIYPTLSFLLISGAPDSKTLPAVRTGELCFLAKPFTINELLAAVRTLLET
jgi:DNA-binding NtrC family response regulator